MFTQFQNNEEYSIHLDMTDNITENKFSWSLLIISNIKNHIIKYNIIIHC